MMSQLCLRKYFVAAFGVAVATVFLAGAVNADETIAWWRFDSSNPWGDSSGNGYDLMGMATSVADDFDGAGTESQGSAYFNGADGWAVTYNAIDLTTYDAVRLSWWMKVDSTALGVPIEQSTNYGTAGGFIVTTNETGEGLGTVCISDNPAKIPPAGIHTESLPHGTQGVWEQYSVEIWPEADSAANVVKIYKNGTLLEDATAYAGLHNMSGQDVFVSDMFYFGSRAASQYFYQGNLDEVKLESFTPNYPVEETPTLVPLTNVVAQWTFDDAANPWADSSGKGHDFSNAGGVVQSDNTPSVTGSSAYFDNSETAVLKTIDTLDLTSYRHLQLSWSQLVTSDEVDILFEQSAYATGTPGGFYAAINEVEPGSALAAMTNGGGRNFNLAKYTHSYGADNTTWENMVLDINLDAESNAMVFTMYRDGEWVSTYFYDNPYDVTPYGDAAESFRNDYFNLGGRDGSPTLNFSGYIDNFTITADAGSTWDIAGDANKDGKVDGSDVTILAGNWQTLVDATWGMGDFNGDGKVDGSDVTILAGNWQYGASTAAASVPEPGTLLLLISLIGTLLVWKRAR